MKNVFTTSFISLVLGAQLTMPVPAHADDDTMTALRDYCESLVQSGTDAEEAKQIVEACISEQRQYLPDDSLNGDELAYHDDSYRYEEEALSPEPEQDCYQVADEQVQAQLDADPDAVIDYEALVNDCQQIF